MKGERKVKVTKQQLRMFNDKKLPSANENVVAQTGYSREVYFYLRDALDSLYGISRSRLTTTDLKKYERWNCK